ncbi:hypothetical protein [Bradyrhizobium zhanjiangense]|uniref:hypothetical protein n=1 Tax=Bradyrhizobium zhanjiangense TaxID=1325107 RepID=UPI001008A8F4|nr:hypothetical protein [Bradyrhizobium zhanjiangense]
MKLAAAPNPKEEIVRLPTGDPTSGRERIMGRSSLGHINRHWAFSNGFHGDAFLATSVVLDTGARIMSTLGSAHHEPLDQN